VRRLQHSLNGKTRQRQIHELRRRKTAKRPVARPTLTVASSPTGCTRLAYRHLEGRLRIELRPLTCLRDQCPGTPPILDAAQAQALLDDRCKRAPLSRGCLLEREASEKAIDAIKQLALEG